MFKTKITRLIASFSALAITLSLVACGNEVTSKTEESTVQQTSTRVEEKPFNAMEKYDPIIDVTVGRIQDDTVKFANGESYENNIWTKAYKDELGINVVNSWVVSAAQKEQKLNVVIASNDIPDILWCENKQYQVLVDGDMIEDMTVVYEKYATDLTKQIMTDDGGKNLSLAKVKGKLMAIPENQSAIDSGTILWVRKDWLTKLGLPEPKTMTDLLAISEAFTNKDPDGNNKKDTFGLGLSKELFMPVSGIDGFSNGYGAFPKIWIKDASGKLVYGSVQPQMKEALVKLQEMYKAGQIDKEFAVKDMSKAADDLVAGKIGIEFGAMWQGGWPLQLNKDKNKDADWQAYAIPSINSDSAKTKIDNAVQRFFCIKKGMKNPEAAVKMLNLWFEKICGDKADQSYNVNADKANIFKYAYLFGYPSNKNIDVYNATKDALASGDASKLNLEQKDTYDKLVKFKGGDNSNFGTYKIFGENGSMSVLEQYAKNQLTQYNEFYGAPTSTMLEKMSTLQKKEDEVFTRIIMGDDINTYDKFVDDWNKQGGEQIVKEVNEWYAAIN